MSSNNNDNNNNNKSANSVAVAAGGDAVAPPSLRVELNKEYSERIKLYNETEDLSKLSREQLEQVREREK